jgi:hypothetical protein
MGKTTLLGAKETWKVRVPREHKFFIWLVLQDCYWTSERHQRHGTSDSSETARCSGVRSTTTLGRTLKLIEEDCAQRCRAQLIDRLSLLVR